METLTYGKHRYSLEEFSLDVVHVCLNRGFCLWILHEMLSILPMVGTQCNLCWLLYLDHACFVEKTQNCALCLIQCCFTPIFFVQLQKPDKVLGGCPLNRGF